MAVTVSKFVAFGIGLVLVAVGITVGILALTGTFISKKIFPDDFGFTIENPNYGSPDEPEFILDPVDPKKQVLNKYEDFSMTLAAGGDKTEFNQRTVDVSFPTSGNWTPTTVVSMDINVWGVYEETGSPYISNGIVIVPQKVRLGVAFPVRLVKATNHHPSDAAYSTTARNGWYEKEDVQNNFMDFTGERKLYNVGGYCVLYFKLGEMLTTAQAHINVDVPVENLQLFTVEDESELVKLNNTSPETLRNFENISAIAKENVVIGSNIIAVPVFTPYRSEYRYMRDGSRSAVDKKMVIYDIMANDQGRIEQFVGTYNAPDPNDPGKIITRTVYRGTSDVFKATSISTNSTILAYSFKNATQEDAIGKPATDYIVVLEIQGMMKIPGAGHQAERPGISVVDVTVTSFTMSALQNGQSVGLVAIPINRPIFLYANYFRYAGTHVSSTSGNYDLGINIADSRGDLQPSKISEVVISVQKLVNGQWVSASEVEVVGSSKVEVVTNPDNASGDYQKMVFFRPHINPRNANASYWEISASEDCSVGSYRFVLGYVTESLGRKVLNRDSKFVSNPLYAGSDPFGMFNQITFRSDPVRRSVLSWGRAKPSEESIVIDNPDSNAVLSYSLNLAGLARVQSQLDGFTPTYTNLRYFVIPKNAYYRYNGNIYSSNPKGTELNVSAIKDLEIAGANQSIIPLDSFTKLSYNEYANVNWYGYVNFGIDDRHPEKGMTFVNHNKITRYGMYEIDGVQQLLMSDLADFDLVFAVIQTDFYGNPRWDKDEFGNQIPGKYVFETVPVKSGELDSASVRVTKTLRDFYLRGSTDDTNFAANNPFNQDGSNIYDYVAPYLPELASSPLIVLQKSDGFKLEISPFSSNSTGKTTDEQEIKIFEDAFKDGKISFSAREITGFVGNTAQFASTNLVQLDSDVALLNGKDISVFSYSLLHNLTTPIDISSFWNSESRSYSVQFKIGEFSRGDTSLYKRIRISVFYQREAGKPAEEKYFDFIIYNGAALDVFFMGREQAELADVEANNTEGANYLVKKENLTSAPEVWYRDGKEIKKAVVNKVDSAGIYILANSTIPLSYVYLIWEVKQTTETVDVTYSEKEDSYTFAFPSGYRQDNTFSVWYSDDAANSIQFKGEIENMVTNGKVTGGKFSISPALSSPLTQITLIWEEYVNLIQNNIGTAQNPIVVNKVIQNGRASQSFGISGGTHAVQQSNGTVYSFSNSSGGVTDATAVYGNISTIQYRDINTGNLVSVPNWNRESFQMIAPNSTSLPSGNRNRIFIEYNTPVERDGISYAGDYYTMTDAGGFYRLEVTEEMGVDFANVKTFNYLPSGVAVLQDEDGVGNNFLKAGGIPIPLIGTGNLTALDREEWNFGYKRNGNYFDFLFSFDAFSSVEVFAYGGESFSTAVQSSTTVGYTLVNNSAYGQIKEIIWRAKKNDTTTAGYRISIHFQKESFVLPAVEKLSEVFVTYIVPIPLPLSYINKHIKSVMKPDSGLLNEFWKENGNDLIAQSSNDSILQVSRNLEEDAEEKPFHFSFLNGSLTGMDVTLTIYPYMRAGNQVQETLHFKVFSNYHPITRQNEANYYKLDSEYIVETPADHNNLYETVQYNNNRFNVLGKAGLSFFAADLIGLEVSIEEGTPQEVTMGNSYSFAFINGSDIRRKMQFDYAAEIAERVDNGNAYTQADGDKYFTRGTGLTFTEKTPVLREGKKLFILPQGTGTLYVLPKLPDGQEAKAEDYVPYSLKGGTMVTFTEDFGRDAMLTLVFSNTSFDFYKTYEVLIVPAAFTEGEFNAHAGGVSYAEVPVAMEDFDFNNSTSATSKQLVYSVRDENGMESNRIAWEVGKDNLDRAYELTEYNQTGEDGNDLYIDRTPVAKLVLDEGKLVSLEFYPLAEQKTFTLLVRNQNEIVGTETHPTSPVYYLQRWSDEINDYLTSNIIRPNTSAEGVEIRFGATVHARAFFIEQNGRTILSKLTQPDGKEFLQAEDVIGKPLTYHLIVEQTGINYHKTYGLENLLDRLVPVDLTTGDTIPIFEEQPFGGLFEMIDVFNRYGLLAQYELTVFPNIRFSQATTARFSVTKVEYDETAKTFTENSVLYTIELSAEGKILNVTGGTDGLGLVPGTLKENSFRLKVSESVYKDYSYTHDNVSPMLYSSIGYYQQGNFIYGNPIQENGEVWWLDRDGEPFYAGQRFEFLFAYGSGAEKKVNTAYNSDTAYILFERIYGDFEDSTTVPLITSIYYENLNRRIEFSPSNSYTLLEEDILSETTVTFTVEYGGVIFKFRAKVSPKILLPQEHMKMFGGQEYLVFHKDLRTEVNVPRNPSLNTTAEKVLGFNELNPGGVKIDFGDLQTAVLQETNASYDVVNYRKIREFGDMAVSNAYPWQTLAKVPAQNISGGTVITNMYSYVISKVRIEKNIGTENNPVMAFIIVPCLVVPYQPDYAVYSNAVFTRDSDVSYAIGTSAAPTALSAGTYAIPAGTYKIPQGFYRAMGTISKNFVAVSGGAENISVTETGVEVKGGVYQIPAGSYQIPAGEYSYTVGNATAFVLENSKIFAISTTESDATRLPAGTYKVPAGTYLLPAGTYRVASGAAKSFVAAWGGAVNASVTGAGVVLQAGVYQVPGGTYLLPEGGYADLQRKDFTAIIRHRTTSDITGETLRMQEVSGEDGLGRTYNLTSGDDAKLFTMIGADGEPLTNAEGKPVRTFTFTVNTNLNIRLLDQNGSAINADVASISRVTTEELIDGAARQDLILTVRPVGITYYAVLELERTNPNSLMRYYFKINPSQRIAVYYPYLNTETTLQQQVEANGSFDKDFSEEKTTMEKVFFSHPDFTSGNGYEIDFTRRLPSVNYNYAGDYARTNTILGDNTKVRNSANSSLDIARNQIAYRLVYFYDGTENFSFLQMRTRASFNAMFAASQFDSLGNIYPDATGNVVLKVQKITNPQLLNLIVEMTTPLGAKNYYRLLFTQGNNFNYDVWAGGYMSGTTHSPDYSGPNVTSPNASGYMESKASTASSAALAHLNGITQGKNTSILLSAGNPERLPVNNAYASDINAKITDYEAYISSNNWQAASNIIIPFHVLRSSEMQETGLRFAVVSLGSDGNASFTIKHLGSNIWELEALTKSTDQPGELILFTNDGEIGRILISSVASVFTKTNEDMIPSTEAVDVFGGQEYDVFQPYSVLPGTSTQATKMNTLWLINLYKILGGTSVSVLADDVEIISFSLRKANGVEASEAFPWTGGSNRYTFPVVLNATQYSLNITVKVDGVEEFVTSIVFMVHPSIQVANTTFRSAAGSTLSINPAADAGAYLYDKEKYSFKLLADEIWKEGYPYRRNDVRYNLTIQSSVSELNRPRNYFVVESGVNKLVYEGTTYTLTVSGGSLSGVSGVIKSGDTYYFRIDNRTFVYNDTLKQVYEISIFAGGTIGEGFTVTSSEQFGSGAGEVLLSKGIEGGDSYAFKTSALAGIRSLSVTLMFRHANGVTYPATVIIPQIYPTYQANIDYPNMNADAVFQSERIYVGDYAKLDGSTTPPIVIPTQKFSLTDSADAFVAHNKARVQILEKGMETTVSFTGISGISALTGFNFAIFQPTKPYSPLFKHETVTIGGETYYLIDGSELELLSNTRTGTERIQLLYDGVVLQTYVIEVVNTPTVVMQKNTGAPGADVFVDDNKKAYNPFSFDLDQGHLNLYTANRAAITNYGITIVAEPKAGASSRLLAQEVRLNLYGSIMPGMVASAQLYYDKNLTIKGKVDTKSSIHSDYRLFAATTGTGTLETKYGGIFLETYAGYIALGMDGSLSMRASKSITLSEEYEEVYEDFLKNKDLYTYHLIANLSESTNKDMFYKFDEALIQPKADYSFTYQGKQIPQSVVLRQFSYQNTEGISPEFLPLQDYQLQKSEGGKPRLFNHVYSQTIHRLVGSVSPEISQLLFEWKHNYAFAEGTIDSVTQKSPRPGSSMVGNNYQDVQSKRASEFNNYEVADAVIDSAGYISSSTYSIGSLGISGMVENKLQMHDFVVSQDDRYALVRGTQESGRINVTNTTWYKKEEDDKGNATGSWEKDTSYTEGLKTGGEISSFIENVSISGTDITLTFHEVFTGFTQEYIFEAMFQTVNKADAKQLFTLSIQFTKTKGQNEYTFNFNNASACRFFNANGVPFTYNNIKEANNKENKDIGEENFKTSQKGNNWAWNDYSNLQEIFNGLEARPVFRYRLVKYSLNVTQTITLTAGRSYSLVKDILRPILGVTEYNPSTRDYSAYYQQFEQSLKLSLEYEGLHGRPVYTTNSLYNENTITNLISLQEERYAHPDKGNLVVDYEITPHGAKKGGDIIHLHLKMGEDSTEYIIRILIQPNIIIQTNPIVDVPAAVGGTKTTRTPAQLGVRAVNRTTGLPISDNSLIYSATRNEKYVIGGEQENILQAGQIVFVNSILGGIEVGISVHDTFGYTESFTVILGNSTGVVPTRYDNRASLYEGDDVVVYLEEGGQQYVYNLITKEIRRVDYSQRSNFHVVIGGVQNYLTVPGFTMSLEYGDALNKLLADGRDSADSSLYAGQDVSQLKEQGKIPLIKSQDFGRFTSGIIPAEANSVVIRISVENVNIQYPGADKVETLDIRVPIEIHRRYTASFNYSGGVGTELDAVHLRDGYTEHKLEDFVKVIDQKTNPRDSMNSMAIVNGSRNIEYTLSTGFQENSLTLYGRQTASGSYDLYADQTRTQLIIGGKIAGVLGIETSKFRPLDFSYTVKNAVRGTGSTKEIGNVTVGVFDTALPSDIAALPYGTNDQKIFKDKCISDFYYTTNRDKVNYSFDSQKNITVRWVHSDCLGGVLGDEFELVITARNAHALNLPKQIVLRGTVDSSRIIKIEDQTEFNVTSILREETTDTGLVDRKIANSFDIQNYTLYASAVPSGSSWAFNLDGKDVYPNKTSESGYNANKISSDLRYSLDSDGRLTVTYVPSGVRTPISGSTVEEFYLVLRNTYYGFATKDAGLSIIESGKSIKVPNIHENEFDGKTILKGSSVMVTVTYMGIQHRVAMPYNFTPYFSSYSTRNMVRSGFESYGVVVDGTTDSTSVFAGTWADGIEFYDIYGNLAGRNNIMVNEATDLTEEGIIIDNKSTQWGTLTNVNNFTYAAESSSNSAIVVYGYQFARNLGFTGTQQEWRTLTFADAGLKGFIGTPEQWNNSRSKNGTIGFTAGGQNVNVSIALKGVKLPILTVSGDNRQLTTQTSVRVTLRVYNGIAINTINTINYQAGNTILFDTWSNLVKTTMPSGSQGTLASAGGFQYWNASGNFSLNGNNISNWITSQGPGVIHISYLGKYLGSITFTLKGSVPSQYVEFTNSTDIVSNYRKEPKVTVGGVDGVPVSQAHTQVISNHAIEVVAGINRADLSTWQPDEVAKIAKLTGLASEAQARTNLDIYLAGPAGGDNVYYLELKDYLTGVRYLRQFKDAAAKDNYWEFNVLQNLSLFSILCNGEIVYGSGSEAYDHRIKVDKDTGSFEISIEQKRNSPTESKHPVTLTVNIHWVENNLALIQREKVDEPGILDENSTLHHNLGVASNNQSQNMSLSQWSTGFGYNNNNGQILKQVTGVTLDATLQSLLTNASMMARVIRYDNNKNPLQTPLTGIPMLGTDLALMRIPVGEIFDVNLYSAYAARSTSFTLTKTSGSYNYERIYLNGGYYSLPAGYYRIENDVIFTSGSNARAIGNDLASINGIWTIPAGDLGYYEFIITGSGTVLNTSITSEEFPNGTPVNISGATTRLYSGISYSFSGVSIANATSKPAREFTKLGEAAGSIGTSPVQLTKREIYKIAEGWYDVPAGDYTFYPSVNAGAHFVTGGLYYLPSGDYATYSGTATLVKTDEYGKPVSVVSPATTNQVKLSTTGSAVAAGWYQIPAGDYVLPSTGIIMSSYAEIRPLVQTIHFKTVIDNALTISYDKGKPGANNDVQTSAISGEGFMRIAEPADPIEGNNIFLGWQLLGSDERVLTTRPQSRNSTITVPFDLNSNPMNLFNSQALYNQFAVEVFNNPSGVKGVRVWYVTNLDHGWKLEAGRWDWKANIDPANPLAILLYECNFETMVYFKAKWQPSVDLKLSLANMTQEVTSFDTRKYRVGTYAYQAGVTIEKLYSGGENDGKVEKTDRLTTANTTSSQTSYLLANDAIYRFQAGEYRTDGDILYLVPVGGGKDITITDLVGTVPAGTYKARRGSGDMTIKLLPYVSHPQGTILQFLDSAGQLASNQSFSDANFVRYEDNNGKTLLEVYLNNIAEFKQWNINGYMRGEPGTGFINGLTLMVGINNGVTFNYNWLGAIGELYGFAIDKLNFQKICDLGGKVEFIRYDANGTELTVRVQVTDGFAEKNNYLYFTDKAQDKSGLAILSYFIRIGSGAVSKQMINQTGYENFHWGFNPNDFRNALDAENVDGLMLAWRNGFKEKKVTGFNNGTKTFTENGVTYTLTVVNGKVTDVTGGSGGLGLVGSPRENYFTIKVSETDGVSTFKTYRYDSTELYILGTEEDITLRTGLRLTSANLNYWGGFSFDQTDKNMTTFTLIAQKE